MVATSDTRKTLESSSLTGFSFRIVEKTHIVELRWENCERPHNPPIANALGDDLSPVIGCSSVSGLAVQPQYDTLSIVAARQCAKVPDPGGI